MQFSDCKILLTPPLIKRAFLVALTAGTILTLINQWDAIFGDEFLSWPKVILTYLVPYTVSSVSSLFASVSHHKERKAILEELTDCRKAEGG